MTWLPVSWPAIWVSCAIALAAQGVPGRTPLTLAEVTERALRDNPDLVAARLRVDSARGEQRIARALPNPSYAFIPNTPFQHSVTENVDLGPARVYRTRGARQGTAAAGLDLTNVARQVAFSARQAFYDVLLADSGYAIARERRDLFRQILAADSTRLRAGDIPARNVAKSELELARADAALDRAHAGVHNARLALQALMGISNPDTAVDVAGQLQYAPMEIPLDSLSTIAAAHRPDLAAAAERVDQSRSLHSLATAVLFPVPAVSLVYQPGGLFPNDSHYAVGIGVSVPLFYRNEGERARATAAIGSSMVSERRTETQVATDVAQARDAYLAARGLARRYTEGLVAKASGVLADTRYAYETGAISQLDLLDAIREYTDTRSDYYAAVHDYWVSLYALSRVTGRELVP